MRLGMRLDLSVSVRALDPGSGAKQKRVRERIIRGQRRRRTPRVSVASRVRRWMQIDEGRHNVVSGRVHPVFYTVLRRARRHYRPTASIVPARMRNRRREYWRSYHAAARAYGKLGKPLPTGRSWWLPNGRIAPLRIIEGNKIIDKAVNKAATAYGVTLCVMARANKPAVIVGIQRSMIPALDRAAKNALEKGLAQQTMPDDLEPTQACYRFSVDLGTRLTRPSVGCAVSSLFNSQCFKPEMFLPLGHLNCLPCVFVSLLGVQHDPASNRRVLEAQGDADWGTKLDASCLAKRPRWQCTDAMVVALEDVDTLMFVAAQTADHKIRLHKADFARAPGPGAGHSWVPNPSMW